jgi:hypothetical protein
MEGWRTSYWFEEGEKSIVLKFFRQPVQFLDFEVRKKAGGLDQGILKGKYHCTVDLLFDWLGLVCFANKNKNCQ